MKVSWLKYWLIPITIYGIPNLVLYWMSLSSGVMVVDMVEIESRIDTFTSVTCLVALLISMSLVVFSCELGKSFFQNSQTRPPTAAMGVAVFVLQLFGLIVLLLFDFGRVGGLGSSDSSLVILSSYLHVDAIFLAYYGHRRGKDVPVINLLLFTISATLRGWSGMWLMLFFIEIYYALQKFPYRKVLPYIALILTAGIISYPAINDLKESIRGTVQLEETSFEKAMFGLTVRLQHVTSVLLIAQEREDFNRAIDDGEVLPVYADNTIGGKVFNAFGGNGNAISLQKYITTNYLIDRSKFDSKTNIDDLGWFVHTGIAGWFFVMNWYELPLYIAFVIFLVIFPYWLAARFIGSVSIVPVLHMCGLVYVFHGWFGVQLGFITGLIWYVLIWMTQEAIFYSGKPAANIVSPVQFVEAIDASATNKGKVV